MTERSRETTTRRFGQLSLCAIMQGDAARANFILFASWNTRLFLDCSACEPTEMAAHRLIYPSTSANGSCRKPRCSRALRRAPPKSLGIVVDDRRPTRIPGATALWDKHFGVPPRVCLTNSAKASSHCRCVNPALRGLARRWSPRVIQPNSQCRFTYREMCSGKGR